MKIKRDELIEQIVIALKDEFNATISNNNEKISINFQNGQNFSMSLQEN